MKSAKEMTLCRNRVTDQVSLVPWPDYAGRSDAYDCVGLACYRHIREASYKPRKTLVFVEAMNLIARDGCYPAVVDKVLTELQEYWDGWKDYILC